MTLIEYVAVCPTFTAGAELAASVKLAVLTFCTSADELLTAKFASPP